MNVNGGKILNALHIEERLSAAKPGRRAAPGSPGGTPGESPGGPRGELSDGARPSGDHDLNPELYEPSVKLIPAAVLVPLVQHPQGMTVLLTRRTAHLHDHAGQIAFPGGRVDAADAGPTEAALREAEEEVGLPRSHVRLVGELDLYVTRTGFEVTPVVGLITPGFPMIPESFEVDEIFEVPLAFFLAPESREIHSRFYRGAERRFYAYPYQDYYIWGATAGMLNNLADLLMEP